MRNVSACGLAAACLLLPACATVTRGTSQKFSIESSPTDADVKLSTGQTCVTPCQLNLKRKHGFVATVTKRGYKTATTNVTPKVRTGGVAGVAGNVLLGGIIGAAVDGSNGAMNDLTPNPLVVTLEPETSPAVGAEVAPGAVGGQATAPVDAAAPTEGETATVATGHVPGQD
jgi:hypothetical protein